MIANTNTSRQSDQRASFSSTAYACSFFSTLPDSAFYAGDQVQHLYLYGPINEGALMQLRADVDAASKGQITPSGVEIAPRPIVLHINSPGGTGEAGMSMMSVFNECRVPICACVDGLSASAATLVSILAPYRVMSPMAWSMVHEYSAQMAGQAEEIRFQVKRADAQLSYIRQMYLARTKMQAAQLNDLLERDLMLSATTCLELGICDRVLGDLMPSRTTTPAKRKPTQTRRAAAASMPLAIALRKTNLNHVRFVCDGGEYGLGSVQHLDALLRNARDLKPIIVHCDGVACMTDMGIHVSPIVTRIGALPVTTYGIIDTQVSLENFLPILFCTHRVMYSHASVVIHLVYSAAWAWVLDDMIANTRSQIQNIRALLRAHTRLPADIVDHIHRRRFMLTADECLKYGMVHEVISVIPEASRMK